MADPRDAALLGAGEWGFLSRMETICSALVATTICWGRSGDRAFRGGLRGGIPRD